MQLLPPRRQPPVRLLEVPDGPLPHGPLDEAQEGPGLLEGGGYHLEGDDLDVHPPAATTTTTGEQNI